MHGFIFAELKKFVLTATDQQTWTKILAAAGLERRVYLTGESYPDLEVTAIVTAASRLLSMPAPALLEAFGDFMVPDLIQTYHPFIRREWSALDLLEKTESVIHKTVRMRDPLAQPPALEVIRSTPREVRITYRSPRRLCAVARGIIKGIAQHYGEMLDVEETTCMHRGDAACLMVITKRET